MTHIKSFPLLLIIQSFLISEVVSQNSNPLLRSFDKAFSSYVANPGAYAQRVRSECSQFPEGALFPYSLVALAWSHKIFETPSTAGAELPKIEAMLDLALSSSAKVVKPPGGRFTAITGMNKQGTYVSQLAMTLAAYRLAGGKRRDLLAVGDRLNQILIHELEARKGQPIYSYPGQIWPFDTSTALFAIELHDRATGNRAVAPLLHLHKNWLLSRGTDSSTGLPGSQILPNGRLVAARGCDLSWRLAFWKELDSAQSSRWYQNYYSRFWKSSSLAKGFREWSSDSTKTVDLDSGPVLYGVGSTATALGICAAVAHSDNRCVGTLMNQSNDLARARNSSNIVSRMKIKTIDGALHKIGISTSKQYITGFLYGDATAFYGMSWRHYPSKPVR